MNIQKSITNSANIIQNMATKNDIKINVENFNATSTNNKFLSG